MRRSATNAFEKNFFKLMVNSFFGKTCENVRKYRDIKLATTEERVRKLTSKPSLQGFKIFHEKLAAVELARTSVKLNKPRYIGFTVLDISKTLMYEFHYNVMKKEFPSTKLLMTDTDSFCYQIETEDLYENLLPLAAKWMDFSNYPETHPNFQTQNKGVVGKFKDETNSTPISEFVGLRSKMYAFEYGGASKKTAKGVKKCVTSKKLSIEDYRNCLLQNKSTQNLMYSIRHENHNLYTVKICKVSLSAYDDKRFLIDNTQSCSYGNKRKIDNVIIGEDYEKSPKILKQ